jgi:hypothetical protein
MNFRPNFLGTTIARRRSIEGCKIGGIAWRSYGIANMLRITVVEDAAEERWILQGRLSKRSVAELVSSWRASTAQPAKRPRIVDLNEVTSIDKSGEEALSMMVQDGATFVASGVYTCHLLDQLQARRRHN